KTRDDVIKKISFGLLLFFNIFVWLFLPQYFLTELQIAEYSALSLLTPTRGIGFISDANTQEVKKTDIAKISFFIPPPNSKKKNNNNNATL
ncbi:hypothetical protein, partial [Escherichia coli]|uniref:hypothetical protein n=1 Tax=Escherichia coli TaxID=562 RepID=UPI0015EFA3B3